jgi:hypothetical protein
MIDRKEIRWLLGFTLVVILLTTLPYFMGYLRQTPDLHFSGFFFSITDSNSYLAKMLRGASGDWLFRTPYTTFPQKGVLTFLPYLMLGKLSAAPGQYDQLIVLFQIFRITGIVLLIWAIYRFLSRFIESVFMRRFGVFMAVWGGGLGWLVVIGLSSLWRTRLPVEFYSPESFGFLSFLGIPHLLFSRALLFLGLEGFLFSAPSRGNLKQSLLFLAPWFLLGFFQPISLMTVWAILAGFLILLALFCRKYPVDGKDDLRKYFINAAWIAVVTIPFLIYNFVAFRVDPVLVSWLSQNILTSPPIPDYLLAFGLILPFALYGLIVLWRKNTQHFLFFGVSIILFPILTYFPLPIQRRLPEGIWIMLIVTALIGISTMGRKWKNFSVITLTLGSLTSFVILLGAMQSVFSPISPRFISNKELEAIQILQSPNFKDAHVLASFDESNRLAAWAPIFLLTGLGPESTNLVTITPKVQRFFQNRMPEREEVEFLDEFGIDLIFYGPEERKLGTWNGGSRVYLTRIFQNSDFEIFSVNRK